MKKLCMLLITFVLLISSSVFCASPAFATYKVNAITAQEDYLIDPNFEANKEKFNISANEVIALSRPLGDSAMMAGQSFAPFIDNASLKTYSTNQVNFTTSDSLEVYVFFGESNSKNLTITLSGQGGSASWTIEGSTINAQVDEITSVKHIRYGWVLINLPANKATGNGLPFVIDTLSISYLGEEEPDEKYSNPYFYAPKIVVSDVSDITFKQKQKFYNYNFTINNISNLCAGDVLNIPSLISILDYAIIGDLDYLVTQGTDYRFNLEITDPNGKKTSFKITNQSAEYPFEHIGTYMFNVSLYKGNTCLTAGESVQSQVHEFVPFYLLTPVNFLKANTVGEYSISAGSFASGVSNLKAASSDSRIADVSVSDGKLIVNAKKAGRVTIKLSADVKRADQTKNYTMEYSLTVKKSTNVNWLYWSLLAIGLIICVIVVYTIMVRRRLIKNKYPKY